jgi:predicted MPP superfamily phosphohydrolase
MKALILSDLHLYFWHQQSELNNYKNIISKITSKDFDCVIICGDIFEYDFVGLSNNPYKLLSELLNVDCPIICCLGNHEYAYSTIDEVHNWFNSFTERYNVHILDIEGHYTYNGFNFVGNVFWYDNTLTSFPFAKPDKIVSNWLDSSIKNFIPSIENAICKKQILDNLSVDYPNILITHTVPHWRLNWFSINQPKSIYNQYSGCKDFLQELNNVKWSFCGHTHKRISDTIHNINCLNIGNDYLRQYNEILYEIVEL